MDLAVSSTSCQGLDSGDSEPIRSQCAQKQTPELKHHHKRPMLSMFMLAVLALLLAVPTHSSAQAIAQPLKELKSATVGKLFVGQVSVTSADFDFFKDTLPIWLKSEPANNTDSSAPETYIVRGIPQAADFGRHLISTSYADDPIEIEVVEEWRNNCGEGTTSWVEIMDARKLGDVTVAEQFQMVENLMKLMSAAMKELDSTPADFRILPLKYLNRYRTVVEAVSDDFGDENGNNGLYSPDQMVLSLNISCGELTDYANDVINVVAENSAIFRVIEGRLNQARPLLVDTTTTAPMTRTTRQVQHRPTYYRGDNKPIAANKLSMFTCKKGILCQLTVSENTFMDAEDGDTRRLSLSVHSIGEAGQRNFLLALPQSTIMEGVPIEVGTFSFRLEARDKINQTASLPFQVKVEEPVSSSEHKPNHEFSMLLEGSVDKFTSKPEALRDFVYRLADSIAGRPTGRQPNYQQPYALHSQIPAFSVKIHELVENGPNQSMLKWSNATLSKKVCQQKVINDTLRQMVGGRNMDRVKMEFRRAMGAQFHVRKVSVDFLRSCLPASNFLKDFKIRATTIETSVDSEPTSSLADSLMIPLILLAFLLLFVMLLILLCWMQRKGVQQKKKKKQQGDYVSKGLPVVFPEEVPHEDENNQATVTTPMLVTKEQPPLDPARMTMHENPLYKPPPTAQATLVKQAAPSTTTFTSAQPIGRLGSSSSVAPRNQGAIAALGQRLPPPYVAAI